MRLPEERDAQEQEQKHALGADAAEGDNSMAASADPSATARRAPYPCEIPTHSPWRAGVAGNNRVYGPNGCGDDSGLIAVVYRGAGNRYLIAAAPELKDGCNALIGLIQIACSRDDMPPEIKKVLLCSHRMDEALAAIAKAEGRDSQPEPEGRP